MKKKYIMITLLLTIIFLLGITIWAKSSAKGNHLPDEKFVTTQEPNAVEKVDHKYIEQNSANDAASDLTDLPNETINDDSTYSFTPDKVDDHTFINNQP